MLDPLIYLFFLKMNQVLFLGLQLYLLNNDFIWKTDPKTKTLGKKFLAFITIRRNFFYNIV